MLTTSKKKETNAPTVLRRMRESSELTMRQVGAMIGISHVAISQFENRKLDLPDYRVEQLVKAYGYTMDEFDKIMGRAIVISPKDDCHAMIDRMDDQQLSAMRSVMHQLLRTLISENAAVPVRQMSQSKTNNVIKTA
ncbi:MAG: helix-turn-helix transcriptional regulator [Pseudomonadota bacterium]|nr:helix-turn-helix transcriptional regulator [Pseudomonadota bacterium]